MMPADNITPRDLWQQLTAMPRAHRMIDFPRKGPDGNPVGELAMWVLLQEEVISATGDAEKRVQRMLKDAGGKEGYDSLMELWLSCELLFRCCRKPEDISKKLFPTVEDIAKHLTTDEIGVLVFNYRTVQSELGPIVSEMSQEEMDAWIEKLAKGGALFPFDLLSTGMRNRLMIYMASRLYPSPTDSSSPGTPPGSASPT